MQVSQNIREYDHAILLYSRASSAKISVWGPTPKMKMQMVKIELVCGAMAMGMEWDSLPRTSRWLHTGAASRTNLAPISHHSPTLDTNKWCHTRRVCASTLWHWHLGLRLSRLPPPLENGVFTTGVHDRLSHSPKASRLKARSSPRGISRRRSIWGASPKRASAASPKRASAASPPLT